jgi:hypothetical protein
MGIFSWFGSRRRAGKHRAGSDRDVDTPDPDLDLHRSLVRINEESPELEEVEEAAAEDVARVREDDKYFGRDAPANQDEL